jgi:two-component system chemotaxis response regulator CheY
MKVNVLVVDYSRVMRGIIMSTLSSSQLAEFEFIEAEDGEEALKKFNPASIDLVLIDWNMPKISGIDFTKEIRKRPDGENVPIVMVTSEKSLGKLEQALDEAGASAYICKPFTTEDFIRVLGKFIDEISQRKQKDSRPGFFNKLLGGG